MSLKATFRSFSVSFNEELKAGWIGESSNIKPLGYPLMRN